MKKQLTALLTAMALGLSAAPLTALAEAEPPESKLPEWVPRDYLAALEFCNTYGKTQKVVYENEEFNLLQAALNIEEGLDGLRYNKVIIATDADVDGMHIRLLMVTFLLQFFPDLIKKGHVYILQTPLFRVQNKKEAKRQRGKGAKSHPIEKYYCYTDEERIAAINKLGDNAEITRFKGLGEISPDEFRDFIGPDMRLDRVNLKKDDAVTDMLGFYMGKNTMERQEFIINNLVVEDDSDIAEV